MAAHNIPDNDKVAGFDRASLFMQELLDSVESLTGIVEQHGPRTLADLMYLHSAVLRGGFIDHYPDESKVLDIARALPSGEAWAKFIKVDVVKTTWTNYYRCPCGEEWDDQWDCCCNDRCPKCGKEIEPHFSDDGSLIGTPSDGLQTLPTPEGLFGRLTTLPGKHFREDFSTTVRRLRRPYFHLSKEDHDAVECLAGNSDVLLFDGTTQVTFGTADMGYALMPLSDPL